MARPTPKTPSEIAEQPVCKVNVPSNTCTFPELSLECALVRHCTRDMTMHDCHAGARNIFIKEDELPKYTAWRMGVE